MYSRLEIAGHESRIGLPIGVGLVSILALIILVIGTAHEARADNGSITARLRPNLIEVVLQPGQSRDLELLLGYESGPAAQAVVERFDYRYDADGQTRTVPISDAAASVAGTGRQRWDGASWVSVVEAPSLSPGDERSLRLRIAVPSDAEPGDRRAYLLVRVVPQAETGEVAIAPSFGVRVYITVPGGSVRRVESLRANSEYLGVLPLGNPVSIGASLENAGTVSLQSGGEVVVERWLGGEVARLKLPDERIVPGQRARIAATWDTPQRWELINRYVARFDFADETLLAATPPAEGFWVINWSSIGWALAAVIGAWLLRRNRIVRASGRGLRAGFGAFREGMRGK